MAQNIFSNCPIITTGCYLYTSVGVAVLDGKYSDGYNVFTVTGGAGLITSEETCSITQMMKVAVMGSSTAAGVGASTPALSFVGRLETYYTGVGNTFINIALSGMNTYEALAASIPGKPPIISTNNITTAVALNPDVILVSYPSNDVALGFTNQETINNLLSIQQTALNAGKAIYFIGTQPRDFVDPAQRTQLVTQNNLILSTFPNNSINVYPDLVGVNGFLNPAVSAGDGVHLNDEGHRRIFNRVVQKNIFQPFTTTTTSSTTSSTTTTTTAVPATTTSTTTAIATTTSTTTTGGVGTFTARQGVSLAGNSNGYYEWLPAGYTNVNGTKFPVIIDFYGLGNNGNGTTQLVNMVNLSGSLGWQIQNNGGNGGGPNFPYPAIVIIPQPLNDGILSAFYINDIINSVKTIYAVDTNKFYLSGFSGGATILNWGGLIMFDDINMIDNVTAMVPICTVADYEQPAVEAFKAVGMAMRLFHGTADSNPFTPFTKSASWVGPYQNGQSAPWPLTGTNGVNVAPSIVPQALTATFNAPDSSPAMTGQGHGIWPIVYSYTFNVDGTQPAKNIYQWMLGWSRPDKPSSFTATPVSSTQINLSWSAVTGAVSYKLERSLSGLNGITGWTQIGGVIPSGTTTFADSSLSSNTQYFYRVRAVGNGSTSTISKSSTVNATTL